MSRLEFQAFLNRCVEDGFIASDEIPMLTSQFDSGQIDENFLPLPLEEAIKDISQKDSNKALLALIASGILISVLSRKPRSVGELFTLSLQDRIHIREVLQDHFLAESKLLTSRYLQSKDLKAWQSEFNTLVKNNILQQAAIGAGRSLSSDERQALSGVIKEQSAYASRFADEAAVKSLMNNPYSLEGMAARAAQYAGPGRSEWYIAAEQDGLYDYVSVNDSRVCSPCDEAEANGPYRAGEGPMPGTVCDGQGNCRCDRIPVGGA